MSSHDGATLAFPAASHSPGCVLFSALVSVSERDGCDSDGAIASSLEREAPAGSLDLAGFASLSRAESVGGCIGVDLPASSAYVHVETALRARTLLAYTFDFECSDDAVSATSWELQGTRDGALWRRIDVRTESSGRSVNGVIFPVAVECAGAGWTMLRVVVRDASGASGGHARKSRAPFRLSRVCTWFSSGADALQSRTPAWTLSVSGSAGLRRLRISLRDGSFDAVTLNTLPFHVENSGTKMGADADTQSNAVAVARFFVTLALTLRFDGAGCAAALWFNGQRAELTSVEECFRAPLHLRGPAVPFLSAAADVSSLESGVDDDSAADDALGADVTSDVNDGRRTCLLRIGDTAGTGADSYPFAALAFDAPADSLLRGISGEISQITYSCGASLSSRRAALADALTAGTRFAASSPRAPPFATHSSRPFTSLEHVALWQPLGDDDPRRSSIPLRRRYEAVTGGADDIFLFGFSARSVASGYAPAIGSLCLAAHDCGPAVYVEDASAGRLCATGVGGVTRSARSCIPTSTPTCPAPLTACKTVVAADDDCASDDAAAPTVGHAFGFESAWSCIDALVYFSHFRVSIPPRAWIEAAHASGARALGCICTEWADGESANAALIADAGRGAPLALALSLIAQDRGFDGWLINIEAALVDDGSDVDTEEPSTDAQATLCASILRAPRASKASAALARWLRALTLSTHTCAPAGVIIWYDAVNAQTGRIQWASSLDARNALFLDSCDGIFLDYHWRPRELRASGVAAAAADRARDVFAGVDVWGRGTWGGGGWSTGVAAARARDAGVSVAVFAPAWIYETRDASKTSLRALQEAEQRLWFSAPTSDGSGSAESDCSDDADTAGAETVEVSVPVVNASGYLLPAEIATTLRDSSAMAAAAATRHGWRISSDGGAGWDVDIEEGETWAKRALDGRLDDGSGGDGGGISHDSPEGALTSFITSHAWCEKSQIVTLPEKGRGGQLRVFEWARGAPPNVADKYRLQIDLLDAAEATLLSFDSGVVTLDGIWRARGVCWKTTPQEGVAVRVVHGGQDAEYWAGHFGSRMRGLCVIARAPRSIGAQKALLPCPSLADALCAPRSVSAELPIETNFCAGRGAGDFVEGVATAGQPWVIAGGARSAIPPRLGTVGNATLSLSHSAAWAGGTSLVINATGAATVDVLAVSLRAPPMGLSIEIIFQALGASATRLRPLLILTRNEGAPLPPSHEELACASGPWTRGTWHFDAGDDGALVVRVRVELLLSSSAMCDARVGVRIGYIRVFASK